MIGLDSWITDTSKLDEQAMVDCPAGCKQDASGCFVIKTTMPDGNIFFDECFLCDGSGQVTERCKNGYLKELAAADDYELHMDKLAYGRRP